MSAVDEFLTSFSASPVVAILRGVKPDEAVAIVETIVDAGIRIVEVPLNSPNPLRSIELLAHAFRGRAVIGAGTVLSVDQVEGVSNVGGQIIVSPNTDTAVIEESKRRGLVSAPGFQTPTEAFTALAAGADVLKYFPGETATPAVLKALSAVIPSAVRILIVGGVEAANIHRWSGSSVAGFGIGGALFKAGDAPAVVAGKAKEFMAALRAAGRI